MYREGESFCQTFELSSRIPEAAVNEAIALKQLHMVDPANRSIDVAALQLADLQGLSKIL